MLDRNRLTNRHTETETDRDGKIVKKIAEIND